MVVGQKFGQSASGDVSIGVFDVAFGEAAATNFPGCPIISVVPATIPDGSRQTPFPQTRFTSSGGRGIVTFALSGTLPCGLLFGATTGVLSGTPQDHGIFTVTVTATDADSCFGSRTYTFLVREQRRQSARH